MSNPGKTCICEFCGRQFKEQRYLSKHLNEGKECRKLRGILFVCLRCGGFHTTKLGELQVHLEDCAEDGRISDVMENYQTKVNILSQRVQFLEELLKKGGTYSSQIPEPIPVDKREARRKILNETFGNSKDDLMKQIISQYDLVLSSKKYNAYLKIAKRLRRVFFKTGDINNYTTVLDKNISYLGNILSKKGFSEKENYQDYETTFYSSRFTFNGL